MDLLGPVTPVSLPNHLAIPSLSIFTTYRSRRIDTSPQLDGNSWKIRMGQEEGGQSIGL